MQLYLYSYIIKDQRSEVVTINIDVWYIYRIGIIRNLVRKALGVFRGKICKVHVQFI